MTTEITASDYLFVYGTLLLQDNKYARFLRMNSEFRSEGKFRGELYDLGYYPGAVYNQKAEQFVSGGIYKLRNVEQVLEELDIYEGMNDADCEYERIIVAVQTETGNCNCWIYNYRHSTADKIRISHGHYISYLKEKTDA